MSKSTNEVQISERITLERKLAAYDYDAIRSNPDLSEEAKERKLSEAYAAHKERHEALLEESRELQAKRKADAREALLTPPTPKGVKGAERERYIQSARDASFRVMDVQDPARFDKLDDLAQRLGDAQLRHAVFTRALELGYGKVINGYLQDRPELMEHYQVHVENPDSKDSLQQRIFDNKPLQAPVEIIGQRV